MTDFLIVSFYKLLFLKPEMEKVFHNQNSFVRKQKMTTNPCCSVYSPKNPNSADCMIIFSVVNFFLLLCKE